MALVSVKDNSTVAWGDESLRDSEGGLAKCVGESGCLQERVNKNLEAIGYGF